MAPSLQVDFIGIGAPKCGTTWLFYALGQHPEICLSEPKESRYFSRDDFWIRCGHDKDATTADNRTHVTDLGLYARHYKHCPSNCVKGEFSTDYLYSQEAASRLHQYFPDTKILVCVRNPADLAYSWYHARKFYYKENTLRTFEDQLEYNSGFLYIGYYAKYLKHYLRYFEKNQMKIIKFESIVQEPEQTIGTLLDFLGLDPKVELDLSSVPKNSTKKSRFASPVPLMKWFSGWMIERDQAILLRKFRNLGVEKMFLGITTVDRPREPMNPQTRERLLRLYRDDIRELEALFGLDLKAWR